jgi:hypothetical protein
MAGMKLPEAYACHAFTQHSETAEGKCMCTDEQQSRTHCMMQESVYWLQHLTAAALKLPIKPSESDPKQQG